jgi:hypothetical protein
MHDICGTVGLPTHRPHQPATHPWVPTVNTHARSPPPCWCAGLEVIQQQLCEVEGAKVVGGNGALKATVHDLVFLQCIVHPTRDLSVDS